MISYFLNSTPPKKHQKTQKESFYEKRKVG